MPPPRPPRVPGRPLAAVALAVALLAGVLLSPSVPSSAAEPATDGGSVASAAASCWEIKQHDPSASSGAYWLWTPALMAPQQFWCDMKHRGGGWVLLGRGREGWQSTYNGWGDPETLRTSRAPSDFATTQLPAQTVDGLLGGRPVSALEDGIRVRRALDSRGDTWQEVRFTLPQRDRWVWTFGAGHPVGSFSFRSAGDTSRGKGGTSRSFRIDHAHRRVVTTAPAGQDYTQGFAYGPQVTADPDADSFLWSAHPEQGYARPYAELYVRPKLSTDDFPAIPATGTPQATRRAIASTWAAPTEWGVTRLAEEKAGEGHVEVQAFAEAEVQGRIFVGGNFAAVQHVRDGSEVEQPFLAAFDQDTGAFLPEFRPALDGEVNALAVLPDGRLAVGGAFTEVQGQRAPGVAVLDPATGAVDPRFRLTLGRPYRSGPVEVRDIEVLGADLYLSGAFTTARGAGHAVSVDNAVRVSATTGEPDPRWVPRFNNAVNDAAPSPDGTKVYFAGHFTQVGTLDARRVAAISTSDGAALVSRRWQPAWSHPEADHQRAVTPAFGRIWVGGSQHSLFSFAADRYSRRSTTVTADAGGDFQAIAAGQGAVYAGCHCNAFAFQDASLFRRPVTGWTQADKISWVGAWTAKGRYLPEFSPMMRSAAGAGVWATLVDSDGALWAGGDLQSVRTGPTTSQRVGGFVRFPLQDHTAPSRPVAPTAVTQESGQVRLSWTASTDEGSDVTYEVLRNDRVVAVTTGTAVDVAGGTADRFFVRAADANGNRSASTTAVSPG